MKEIILLVLSVHLASISGCSRSGPVEINHVSAGDIKVTVQAIQVPLATHGDLVITDIDSNQELARIRVIEATDYVADVRYRFNEVRADGLRVRICMKNPPADAPSPLFTSTAGVAVTLVDTDLNPHECRTQ